MAPWNYSGIEVTAVFVGTLFQKISFFSSSDLAQTAYSDIFVFVCLYFCNCVFLVFLCVFRIFVFVFEAFSSFCSLLTAALPSFAGKA